MSKHNGQEDSGLQSPEMFLEEITEHARAGRFSDAEKVRAQLLERYPMELGSILKSAEIIEEQMSLQLDREHVQIWADLYEQLTSEETNRLFHSMRKVTVPKGKLIIRQGKPENRLLFIDSGRVTLFHTREQERILLGQLSRRDILGDETFLSLSTPTFSAGSQTGVELYYLNKSDTSNWEKTDPGLYPKLMDFCRKNSRAAELVRENKFEKRSHDRRKIEGKLKIKVISDETLMGNGYGVGSLADISPGGLSFEIHSSQPDNARMLLGCEIDIAFKGTSENRPGFLHLPGLVVRVGDLFYGDFMLHVRFKSMLSEQEFERLVRFIGSFRMER